MTEADLARFAEYAEGESKAARTTSFEWTEVLNSSRRDGKIAVSTYHLFA